MHLQKFAKFAEDQAYMPPDLKTKNGFTQTTEVFR